MLERLGVPDLWDFDPQEWEHVTGRIPRGEPAAAARVPAVAKG
jgi:hypothetical protein